MVLVSMLTRMRLTAMGQFVASVPFRPNAGQMELLLGREACTARRHVAAHTSAETLSALRSTASTSSKNWQLLQASLFAGGIRVCPMSGTPVTDIDACTPELKEAMWTGLTALSRAVNDRNHDGFDESMKELARHVQAHVQA